MTPKGNIQKETIRFSQITGIDKYTNIFANEINYTYLMDILNSKDISAYNRFIYFSLIAKDLFILNGQNNIAFAGLSIIAAGIPIVYDTRTGTKPGCVYYPSYSKYEPNYNQQCCVYYDKKWKYCYTPALDCSGFVSWMLNITGLANYPINEFYWGQSRKSVGSSGNWNIFESKLVKPIDDPKPGCLVFFPHHVGIVTKVDNGNIKEFVHSYKPGVIVSTDIDMEWLLNESVNAVLMTEDVNHDNKYLLGEVI